MIVKTSEFNRCWIVLPVTKKDISKGINADKEGLYGFGGMWYGRNPMKIKSYGKIIPLDYSDIKIIHPSIRGLSVNYIQSLVN